MADIAARHLVAFATPENRAAKPVTKSAAVIEMGQNRSEQGG